MLSLGTLSCRVCKRIILYLRAGFKPKWVPSEFKCTDGKIEEAEGFEYSR